MEPENKPSNMTEPVMGSPDQNIFKKPMTKMKPMWLILIAVVLIFAAGFGAYMWRDNTANVFEKKQSDNLSAYMATITDLQKKLADEKALNLIASTTACKAVAPGLDVLDNIKASITSGNTAALEGYMATSVNVVFPANEGVSGMQIPTQAVTQITNFITQDISTWNYDFALSAATLTGYQQGTFAQYFPSIALVGKAPNNQVISFSFDCDGKISTVFMAGDESSI